MNTTSGIEYVKEIPRSQFHGSRGVSPERIRLIANLASIPIGAKVRLDAINLGFTNQKNLDTFLRKAIRDKKLSGKVYSRLNGLKVLESYFERF